MSGAVAAHADGWGIVSDTQGNPSMAAVMADMPVVWRRLLLAHVPDRLGRCTSCRNSSGSGELWPCSLHKIAAEARRLYGLRLGQAVGGE